MGSRGYTPRHAARHAAPRRRGRGAASLRSTVGRPLVGGTAVVAVLGSIGATVAFGNPADADGVAAAALTAPQRDVLGVEEASSDPETTERDTARLAESRRTTNVSRSASREEARRAAEKKKAKEEAAERKAKRERAQRKKEREAAKPISERDFTDTQLAGIQADPKPYAIELMREFGWSDDQWGCLDQLWNGESDWAWDATNPYSGAYGIPQSLPASKMASAGDDWRTNPVTQMSWGMEYIQLSYGTPCGALDFWNSQNPHWY